MEINGYLYAGGLRIACFDGGYTLYNDTDPIGNPALNSIS